MMSRVLRYATYGNPAEVIEISSEVLAKLSKKDVLLRFLAAPINPSDYNQVEGKYPIRPQLPAIGGNEGSAEVMEVGSDVTKLKVGDKVIPRTAGFGTWRTHCVVEESSVKRVPACLSGAASAMLAVNPCTAYRMIHDFGGRPNPGDWIIQNGSNSAVGRAVIQLCKIYNINSINIIRDRGEGSETLKQELRALGGDVVFTTTEGKALDAFCRDNTPQLAFNMVGGRETIQLLKCLGNGGKVVTYGAMSNSPLSVPFGLQVFKDITLYSYWMTRWTKQHTGTNAEDRMFEELAEFYQSGSLSVVPHDTRSFYDYKTAFSNAFKRKQLFVTDLTLKDSRCS